MNWYKLRIRATGEDTITYIGSSSDPCEKLIEKASRGEYLRLDDMLFHDRGELKEWAKWDNREIPTVYINPANVIAIQPFKADPRTLPK